MEDNKSRLYSNDTKSSSFENLIKSMVSLHQNLYRVENILPATYLVIMFTNYFTVNITASLDQGDGVHSQY